MPLRATETEILRDDATGTSTATEGSPGHDSGGGVLVSDKHSSHYFDEVLLSRGRRVTYPDLHLCIRDNLREPSEGYFSESLEMSRVLFISPAAEGQLFRPTKWQATQLWQTFISVFEGIIDPSETTEDTNALLFAVFYVATTSLEEDELSARANKAGRSVWVLNGLAIRIAQSIGLHQDGNQLNLSPFDSEMRRRLWWHLWAKDSRASEDHGITVFNTYDFFRKVDFSLNVNDSELDPGMGELPPSKSKWSEMTYPLIAIKASHALQKLYFLANPSSSNGSSSNEQARKETVRRLTAHIEKYNQNGNPDIPIHAQLCSSHASSFSKSGPSKLEDRKSLATEEHLISACEILELHHQITTDDLLREFHWAFEACPQYHLLLYVLYHLGVKPIGPDVDRAWRAVDASLGYNIQSTYPGQKRDILTVTGPKLAILEMMRKKAMDIRQSTNSNHNDLLTAGEEQCCLEPTMGHFAGSGAFDPAGHGGMASDVMNWTAQDSAFPDWNTLVEDIDMHPQAFGFEE
ncbi:hypothetical protein BDW69DRAFT_180924 [Aspergillus filifer]